MILSKDQLVSNISTELSDNSTGQISPYDIRHNMLDIIDSVHILIQGYDLDTNNFSTPETRTTKAGHNTIKNINLTNYISEDNSAFGHSALSVNYQGIKNTALGSSALSCNVYGSDNVAIGYNSLGSNAVGFSNIGLGNYSLNNNRFGSGNIAIGHAAGYYADPRTNYKLYISSFPIDSGYICDNPNGSGLTPLVYGDLQELKFGIAVNDLHNDGTLQVSGAISPSQSEEFNLGSESYRWKKAFLSSGINFPSGDISHSYSLSGISISDNLVPDSHNTYDFGSLNNRWNKGYFDEVIANTYTVVDQCGYSCKTVYLASSGDCEPDHPCGYLNDQELEDAGFVIQSSGDDNSYLRNYYFKFKPSGDDYTCYQDDNVYSRSSWNSNISIHISSGCHLKTDRVIGSGDLSLVSQPNCFGLFIKDGTTTYLSQENVLTPNPISSNGHIAGIGDVNFLHPSGSTDDYIFSVSALESGVNVSQRFLSGTKSRVKDSSNLYKDKLQGFEIKYFDDSNLSYSGPLSDRLVFNSYNATSEPVNSVVMLKGGSNGVFGINDFGTSSQYMLPSTTLNIRSQNDSVIRSTAESDGYYQSSLQLLGHDNCLISGIELSYYNNSGIADLSMYKDSGKEIFMRFDEDGKVGFFSVSGQMDDMVTIGGSGHSQAVVSINETVGSVSSTEKYGKIFVKEKVVSDTQSSSLYFLDSSGNQFDIILNKYDDDSGLLFTDNSRNTLGGIGSNNDRSILENNATDNTALGFFALNSLTSGDYNVAIGTRAAARIITGSNNIAIGYNAMGYSSTGVYNNIVIGNNSLGYLLDTNNTLLIGNNIYPVLSGNLSPSDRHLFMPEGTLSLESADRTETLSFNNNVIEVTDNGGDDYPQNELTFKFTGNETADLLTLKHSGVPLSKTPTYEFSNSGIPYAELNGDLRLLNAIRFSDGTSLETAPDLNLPIQNSGILSNLIIEGIAQEDVMSGGFNTPTSGIIKTRENVNIFVSNRDQYLQIHRNDFVIALNINGEYRPLWVSSEINTCQCCNT